MNTRIMLATAATVALVGFTTPANAVRPIAGYDYPDLCKNRGTYAMPGKQTGVSLASGFVRFVDPSQEPNRHGKRNCEDGWRTRH